MITVRADMPTMDGRISMTIEPIFEEGTTIAQWVNDPDPLWSYTDPAGHRFTHENLKLDAEWKTEFFFDADGMENSEQWQACRICGAEIRPKYIPKAPIYTYRAPDRYLGMKTTLEYVDADSSTNWWRKWVFNNDEWTQEILDSGQLSPEMIHKLGIPTEERFETW